MVGVLTSVISGRIETLARLTHSGQKDPSRVFAKNLEPENLWKITDPAPFFSRKPI